MSRIALVDADETAYKIALKYQKKWYHVRKDGVLKWKYHLKDEAIESIGNRDDLDIEEFIEVLDPTGFEDDIDMSISKLLHSTSSTSIKLCLSGSKNFRYELATLQSYKGQATRDDSTKPVHLQLVKDGYIRRGAEIVDFLEADDVMSAYQTILKGEGKESVICSSDKDLRTVPGLNYNIGKGKMEVISEAEADYNFFYQLLIGDSTDNIPSPYSLGDVSARKFLDPLMGSTPQSYYKHIVPFYQSYLAKIDKEGNFKTKWYKKGLSIHDVLWEVGNLLWMHRTLNPEERWSIKDGT